MDGQRLLDGNFSPGRNRVKKLLEHFEKPPVNAIARSSNPSLAAQERCQSISRHRSSKQGSAGIYQRRSILKRQSKSHTDIRPSGRSSTTVRRRSVMSKSYSHGDQADLISAIRRDVSKKSVMTSSDTNVAIVLATPVISRNIGRDDACDMSHLIQSMCVSDSSTYAIGQGQEHRSRPKPPPPIKPATLKNKIGCRSTQNLFSPQTSKPDLSIADKSLPRAPSDVINSSETASEERTNHAGEVIYISEDIITESDPSFEAMRITALCIEEFKKVENDPHSLESAEKPNSGTIITNKRASFINEEIKKPKIKPPPPPIQSHIRRSQSGRDTSKVEAIRKKLNLEGVFDTNRNIAPNNASIDESTSSNTHRFERCLESLDIPSVPSIPPPLPPMLSPHDALNDETYEEIEQLTYAEENGETGNKTETVDELIDEVLMRESNCDKSGQGESYTDRKGNQFIDKSIIYPSNNHFEATLREFNESNVRRDEKAATMRRPKSALEFDKLLRIKSDIQLNITRKVGQIKFKVSSASQERQRCKRLSFIDRERSKNYSDDKVLAKIDFPLDEQCIYGDVWSSDEDDYICSTDQKQEQAQMQSQKSNLGEVINVGKDKSDEPYSMLSEIERELRLRFQTHNNLPDIVLESRRRSMSADPLVHDSTSITAKRENASGGWRCIQGYGSDNDGVCCQTKDDKQKPSTEGYETIISSISPSSEHNCLPSTSSDYTLREIDRSIYTARVIPDPQPLYQIYMMEQNGQLIYETKEQKITQPSFSGKSISKMQRVASTASTDSGRGADCSTTMSQPTSNTSMRRERLVAGSHFASQRSLWCELPEVRNAGLLERLDEDMKKLQEAYFEVITSEASYLRSINILITHFMAAPEMLGSKRPSSTITNEERKQLFSNIFAVRDCSEKLLSDLENRLQESLVLSDICDILCDHFETNFDPYIKYCSNQVYQDRTLRKLKSENPSFLSCIQRLESDRLCQGLDMRSFLMLPMQRVTRYPLLMIAILEHAQQDAANYQTAQIALYLANHIVTCCNEGARHMERTEQLLEIERRLVYKSSDLRRIPLVSSGRYLVKRGSLICLNEKRSKKLLNTRQQFQSIYIFLFNDIIMLTKKKVNGTYICKDYSARRFVDIEPVEVNDPKLLQSVTAHIPLKKPHLFICTLMHNAVGKQVELLLNADSETDRERWLSALRPPTCTNPEEKIYADWDCPQAVAVHRYSPSQEDELPLERGDLINILRKMPDGWFYGERVRDCYSGWFPSSYVQQVLNDHVRAKNYRQRLRVIQAAADFRFHQKQMKIGTEENARHIMERFRRLSNTKSALKDLKSNQTC
ncbi:RhoGEF domain family protein [Brugia pahangi]